MVIGKAVIIFLIFFLSVSGFLNAQNQPSSPNKNSLSLYLPVCHFFDITKTNWGVLVPYYRTGSKTQRKTFPTTLGIQYEREINETAALRMSALFYSMRYSQQRTDFEPGEVLSRKYGLFSIGYVHKIVQAKSINVQAIGELNYRGGRELIYIYRPRYWEIIVESLPLTDIGLSGGLGAEQELPLKFLISAEAKYTRFVYRHQGVEFFEDEKKPSPNTLTFKIGLGYRF